MQAFERLVPKAIVDEVYRRAQKNDADITIAVRLTEDEWELAKATNDPSAKTGVTEKAIGHLSGLAIFRAGNEPWRLAEYTVRPACEKLLATDSDKVVYLNRLIDGVSRANGHFDRIESGLNLSMQFFTNENLANLQKLPNAKNVRFKGAGISSDGVLWVSRG